MNEGHNIYKLPKGWNWVKLEHIVDDPKKDLVDGPFGSNLKADEFVESGIPVFKIQNIKANRFIDKKLSFITKQKAEKLKRHSFREGDLIITKLGDPLGLCCEVPRKYSYGIIVADLMRLRPSKDKINDKYLVTVINSEVVQKQFKAITKGTTRPRVNLSIVRNLLIPVPDKSTQQAIVSKIEKLFSELDKGIEQLKIAQQQLKIYRQSVLKWAFEGRLTNESVKDGELPEAWKWVLMNDVCDKIGDIDHKMPKQISDGYPYISTKDFTDDLKISFDNAKYISKEDYLNLSRKIKPEKGDIIFPRYGTIGKNILIDFDKEFLVSYSCAVIKPNQEVVISKYLYLYSLSPKVTDEIRKYVVETTQANIGIASIKKFVFPLPPIEEQQKVVEVLENRLRVANKMEEYICQSLQKADALRQSILKRAFEGKLVSTDTIEIIKETAKVIPLERKVLAGKIIHLLHDDKYFGLTKFQKILYLVENFAEVPYETNFIQERAGPYDKQFTTAFRKEMQEKDWLQEEQKGNITKFVPGENIGSLIKDYAVYFREKGKQIVFVIQQLKDKSTHEAELIATLYAVWNNRLIKKKQVKIDLLVEDFFKWSPKKKEEFQPEEVVATFKWMKQIQFVPSGFGKVIGTD